VYSIHFPSSSKGVFTKLHPWLEESVWRFFAWTGPGGIVFRPFLGQTQSPICKQAGE
jgi:hypothetical protein